MSFESVRNKESKRQRDKNLGIVLVLKNKDGLQNKERKYKIVTPYDFHNIASFVFLRKINFIIQTCNKWIDLRHKLLKTINDKIISRLIT